MLKNLFSLLVIAFGVATGVHGQSPTLTSIDFTAQEGTSWNDSVVRLNFGQGLGMGTVEFFSINGGSFGDVQTPFSYNSTSGYSGSTLLSNGALFSPTEESVFFIQPGSGAVLSGFQMKVTLDDGVFSEGSLFSVRSLSRYDSSGVLQFVRPVAGFSSMLMDQLPSDGDVSWAFVNPDEGLYAASESGNSTGMAWLISGDTFTMDFLTSPNFSGGGVAFTMATPVPVPEPGSAVLVGSVLCGSLLLVRRRPAVGL